MNIFRRLYPVVAFFGGFIVDALTLGKRVRVLDFWQLGAYLAGAAVFILWLAWRDAREKEPPLPAADLKGHVARFRWQAPYLLVQFFFGSIFSALFILYFKSSGHFGAWITAAALGALLVANEFAGDRYGRRFTLTWALFALNAILLLNFVLPHLAGSLDPRWFYASTLAGVMTATVVYWLAPGRPGRIGPAWGVAVSLLAAWNLGMIAPVPLVSRDQATTVHVEEGGRLYGVTAVFAPLGVTAYLEHRWEVFGDDGWRLIYRNLFRSTGGRERGFRGYSWVLNPEPGEWRFSVATQDGRVISVLPIRVERGDARLWARREREF